MVIDEAELQRHQQLEKLYRSTRAGRVRKNGTMQCCFFITFNFFLPENLIPAVLLDFHEILLNSTHVIIYGVTLSYTTISNIFSLGAWHPHTIQCIHIRPTENVYMCICPYVLYIIWMSACMHEHACIWTYMHVPIMYIEAYILEDRRVRRQGTNLQRLLKSWFERMPANVLDFDVQFLPISF